MAINLTRVKDALEGLTDIELHALKTADSGRHSSPMACASSVEQQSL